MIICILFLFFFSFFISFIEIEKKRYKIFLFVLFGVILFLLSGLRGYGVDRDYSGYVDAFNEDLNVVFAEPSFLFISWLVKSFFQSNVVFLFLIYSFLGVFTKFLAIKQLTEFWFLSILMYIAYSFTLHEMTQIRVGVGIGFLLLCIKPLYDRNLFLFLFYAVLAFFFHYSIFFVFILWFMDKNKLKKSFYSLLIIGAYIINILFKNQISSVITLMSEGGGLEAKVIAYQFENNTELNIFNAWQLLRIALSFLFIYKIDLLQVKNKYSILLTKIYVFAACSFVLLSYNPSFAGRISDVLSIVDIILIPYLMYVFSPRIYSKILVLFIGIAYLGLNLFYNKILN